MENDELETKYDNLKRELNFCQKSKIVKLEYIIKDYQYIAECGSKNDIVDIDRLIDDLYYYSKAVKDSIKGD